MTWEVRFSNSRKLPYFYNPQTHESTWDTPAGMSQEAVNALPGAAQYLRGEKAQATAPAKAQVQCSHILAKHTGSRRPSSWRQDVITRSRDEARDIIRQHIDTLSKLSGEERNQKFAAIATEESDCSSARKGGDLGFFGKNMMQAAFEEASFALKPGEMSDIVETDSGVHVILRTA